MTALFPDPDDLVRAAIARRGERETVPTLTQYDMLLMESCGIKPDVHRLSTTGIAAGWDRERLG